MAGNSQRGKANGSGGVFRFFGRLFGKKERDTGTWSEISGKAGLSRREYSRYEEYLTHQRGKLDQLGGAVMSEYDVKYRQQLRARLESSPLEWRGKSVLCLAARIGTEVKAFRDVGCYAVGVDLNPGKDNPLVLAADFHFLPFRTEAMDAVFTNSLDHAFDVERLVGETRRVLKPRGQFVAEAATGSKEGREPGKWESFWWSKIDDLVKLMEGFGFRLVDRRAFDQPWRGEHLVFEKT
jgi:SAM-dependent methyltransferase